MKKILLTAFWIILLLTSTTLVAMNENMTIKRDSFKNPFSIENMGTVKILKTGLHKIIFASEENGIFSIKALLNNPTNAIIEDSPKPILIHNCKTMPTFLELSLGGKKLAFCCHQDPLVYIYDFETQKISNYEINKDLETLQSVGWLDEKILLFATQKVPKQPSNLYALDISETNNISQIKIKNNFIISCIKATDKHIFWGIKNIDDNDCFFQVFSFKSDSNSDEKLSTLNKAPTYSCKCYAEPICIEDGPLGQKIAFCCKNNPSVWIYDLSAPEDFNMQRTFLASTKKVNKINVIATYSYNKKLSPYMFTQKPSQMPSSLSWPSPKKETFVWFLTNSGIYLLPTIYEYKNVSYSEEICLRPFYKNPTK